MRKFQKRRIPFSLPSIKSKWISVYFQTAHLPNPESRIFLSKSGHANPTLTLVALAVRLADHLKKND